MEANSQLFEGKLPKVGDRYKGGYVKKVIGLTDDGFATSKPEYVDYYKVIVDGGQGDRGQQRLHQYFFDKMGVEESSKSSTKGKTACKACGGKGHRPAAGGMDRPCDKCDGLGRVEEGYTVMPSIDRERYTEIDGLEGPFQAKNGGVYYYDPREGKYYDRDKDMYIDDEEFQAMNESVKKIACVDCDAVITEKAWQKNKSFCPKCKKSNKGVAEDISESITVTATAETMDELVAMLMIAGIEPPADMATITTAEPVTDVNIDTGCDSYDGNAPTGYDFSPEDDISYTTDKNAIMDKIRSAMATKFNGEY